MKIPAVEPATLSTQRRDCKFIYKYGGEGKKYKLKGSTLICDFKGLCLPLHKCNFQSAIADESLKPLWG